MHRPQTAMWVGPQSMPFKALSVFCTSGFRGTLNLSQQINRMSPMEDFSPCVTPNAAIFNMHVGRPFTGRRPGFACIFGFLPALAGGIEKLLFQSFAIEKLKLSHLTEQARAYSICKRPLPLANAGAPFTWWQRTQLSVLRLYSSIFHTHLALSGHGWQGVSRISCGWHKNCLVFCRLFA